ncbi:G-protein coupled receptor [Biomphalaria glabrata]|nr:G-protein coupled receptor [Biomphalaria glabrata]
MISLEILRRNGLHKHSNILLFGLVLADCLYLISGMNFAEGISDVGTGNVFPFLCLFENEALQFFLVACDLAISNAGHWGLLVGAVIPILVTGERLLAIFRPMACKTLVTAKKTAVTVACSFMVSLTWIFCVNLMFTPVKVSLSELVIRIYLRQPKTQTTLLVAKLGLHIINISLSYLTVAIVTPGCCIIWVKVQLTLRRRRKLASFHHQHVMSSRETRTIIVTCLLCVLTDGTVYVCTSIAVLFEGVQFYFLHESKFYIYPLKACSSCFVYILCNENFYRHFKEILRISDGKKLELSH